MVRDAPFFFAVCTGMNQHVSEDINFVPKIAKGKPISKEQSDAWNRVSHLCRESGVFEIWS